MLIALCKGVRMAIAFNASQFTPCTGFVPKFRKEVLKPGAKYSDLCEIQWLNSTQLTCEQKLSETKPIPDHILISILSNKRKSLLLFCIGENQMYSN